MKKLFAFLLFAIAWGMAADAEIVFEHGPWKEILAKASRENKLVFLDAYASWCGPCKWMSANAFMDPEVSTFFNAHFVNAKIDMEKGEGPELSSQFAVGAYPTLIFVNSAGKAVQTAVGALDAAALLKLGQDVFVQKGAPSVDPKSKASSFNNNDRHTMASYILLQAKSGDDYSAALEKFKPGMAGNQLLQKDNWDVFCAVFQDRNLPQSQYFLNHLDDFAGVYGWDPVNAKALDLYMGRLQYLVDAGDGYVGDIAADFEFEKRAFVSSGYPGAVDKALELDLKFYAAHSDWYNLAKAVSAYRDQSNELSSDFLNNTAWSYYQQVEDASLLKSALSWSSTASDMERNYANLDTKAMLLKKLGRFQEAIPLAREAITIARRTGENSADTKAALNEMLTQ
jgi:thiol-disulfide isomerase/thioredoxin